MCVTLNCLQEILDQSYEAVYVTDMNYNILYVNQKAKELGHCFSPDGLLGQKCYHCLLHQDSPCPFCRIDKLTDSEFTVRSFYASKTKHTYELRGKLTDWNGSPAHIEYIRDITSEAEAHQELDRMAVQQQNIFDHTNVGMCMYRAHMGALYPVVCNDAYRQIFHLSADFSTGMPVQLQLSALHPDDRQSALESITDHLNTRTSYTKIFRTLESDSDTIHSVLFSMNCIPQDGLEDLWYITAFDVTSWEETNAKLSNVLSNINGGIALYQVSSDFCRILMYTDGIPKMQGYTRAEYEELISHNAICAIYPEDRNRLLRTIFACARDKTSFSATCRFYHKELGSIWVDLAATPIGIDSEGYMRYNVVLTSASQQFELYQQIFDTTENGIFVTDYDTKEVYYINQTGQKILDTMKKDCPVQGRIICNLGSSGDLCPSCAMCADRNFKRRITEVSHRKYQVASHPVRWMGRSAIVQYFTDITEETALQSKLELNEDRFRIVVEKSGIKLIDYDVLSGEAYTNIDFSQYDFPEEVHLPDFINQHKIELITHPDDKENLREFLNRPLDETHYASSKLRLRLKNGSYRWNEMNRILLHDKNGTVIRKITFFADVDAVTRQYQELQARFDYETARSHSFENGVIERITLNLTNGTVVSAANSQTSNLHQLEGKQIEDLLKLRLCHTPDPAQKELFSNFMCRENLLQAYNDGKNPSFESISRNPATGDTTYFQISANFAKEPNSGSVMAFIDTRNIDFQKTSDNMTRRLLETNYDFATVINVHTGKIKMGISFPEAEFVTDIKECYDALATENINRNVPKEDQNHLKEVLSLEYIVDMLSKSKLYSDKCTILENGVSLYKMWTATYFDESKDYILLTVTDVTEMYKKDAKMTQSLKEALDTARIASQAKTQFLARMSHEIRTPISTVSGILDLIRMKYKSGEPINDDFFQYIDTADTANKYLLTLINDILDISKIEKNELKLSEAPGNIRQVILPLSAMINPLAQKKHITLVQERKTVTTNWYKMDGLRIQQILMNLLSNAIKFTPEYGTITFTGETISKTDTSAVLRFMVRDTGVGISDDFKKDVFEPFRQEYSDSTSSYGGTGLGLAISKKLANLMGGDITFTSKKGEGSVFYVTMELPFATPQKEPENPTSADPISSLQGIRILLCEDNPTNQMIVKKLLQAKGCIVTTADDGAQGVKIFCDNPMNSFDIILMDIRMPNLDGLKATETIRSLGRIDGAEIPIIAMSANAYEEDRLASLAAGMNEHLSKPVDAARLYQVLAEYCKDKKK